MARSIFAGLSLALILAAGFGCSNERVPTALPSAHPGHWLDTNSADFHGKVVGQNGTANCQTCHGGDFRGGKVGVSCIDCHLSSPSHCLSCHGGIDNNSGAPPMGLRAEVDDTTLAVGAHTAHMEGVTHTDGVPCASCHLVPPFLFDSLHLDLASGLSPDFIAEIVWGDIAAAGGTWDRDARTCAGTYCHGNFAGGDAGNTPVWTAPDQANCGSCHDVGSNPASLGWKHEFHVSYAGLQCADCHSAVVDAGLNITALDLHVNGAVDTLTRDAALCATCHAGAGNVCVICHGGTDNQTGAPPVGLRGETSTADLAVGAHSAHLSDGTTADAFDCIVCHTKPASILQAGHLGTDSVAEITWGGIAPATGINWDRDDATCASTYCHGNFPNGYETNTPVWTAGNPAACGSCHDADNDPRDLSGKHRKHVDSKGFACSACHAATVDDSFNIIGPDVHVNGSIEIVFSSGQGVWDGTSCTNVGCHGKKKWR